MSRPALRRCATDCGRGPLRRSRRRRPSRENHPRRPSRRRRCASCPATRRATIRPPPGLLAGQDTIESANAMVDSGAVPGTGVRADGLWKVSDECLREEQRSAVRSDQATAAQSSGGLRAASISVVLAGGGTAGHVEPAMAVADALTELDPAVRITALGTARGLETKLVPERGYQLELITPVPLPRKPTGDLARLPARVLRAVRQPRAVLDKVDADVVIGFGGYVSLPAYLAARGAARRRRRVPVVIHEANASAGLANRVG